MRAGGKVAGVSTKYVVIFSVEFGGLYFLAVLTL